MRSLTTTSPTWLTEFELESLKEVQIESKEIIWTEDVKRLHNLKALDYYALRDAEAPCNLPEAIYHLPLERLRLWGCTFGSNISLFENLTHLSCTWVDRIELSAVAQLTKLVSLDLSNNKLSEPPDVTRLTNLKALHLSHNCLSTFPDITALPIETLYLWHNQLTALPKEIGRMTSLTLLNVGYNRLTQLPKEMTMLTNLQDLSLASNCLVELPRLELPKLVSLIFSHNNISVVPFSHDPWPQLET